MIARRIRQTAAWLLAAWGATAACADPPLREMETRMGRPLPSGISVVQIRMTPTETVEIHRMVFDCVLRQEFLWRGSDGEERLRTIEPARFTHREQNVRMVADLDLHVMFRVPIREEDLLRAYGTRTFRPGFPVVISRIRIEAQDEAGKPVWVVETPMDHVLRFGQAPAAGPPEPEAPPQGEPPPPGGPGNA